MKTTDEDDCSNQYWIGLSFNTSSGLDRRIGRGWVWSDGSPSTWTYWNEREPHINELVTRIYLPGWSGANPSAKFSYLCKRGTCKQYGI